MFCLELNLFLEFLSCTSIAIRWLILFFFIDWTQFTNFSLCLLCFTYRRFVMSTVRWCVLSAIFNKGCTGESVMIEYVNYCTRHPRGYSFTSLGLSCNNLVPSSKAKNLFTVRNQWKRRIMRRRKDLSANTGQSCMKEVFITLLE